MSSETMFRSLEIWPRKSITFWWSISRTSEMSIRTSKPWGLTSEPRFRGRKPWFWRKHVVWPRKPRFGAVSSPKPCFGAQNRSKPNFLPKKWGFPSNCPIFSPLLKSWGFFLQISMFFWSSPLLPIVFWAQNRSETRFFGPQIYPKILVNLTSKKWGFLDPETAFWTPKPRFGPRKTEKNVFFCSLFWYQIYPKILMISCSKKRVFLMKKRENAKKHVFSWLFCSLFELQNLKYFRVNLMSKKRAKKVPKKVKKTRFFVFFPNNKCSKSDIFVRVFFQHRFPNIFPYFWPQKNTLFFAFFAFANSICSDFPCNF